MRTADALSNTRDGMTCPWCNYPYPGHHSWCEASLPDDLSAPGMRTIKDYLARRTSVQKDEATPVERPPPKGKKLRIDKLVRQQRLRPS